MYFHNFRTFSKRYSFVRKISRFKVDILCKRNGLLLRSRSRSLRHDKISRLFLLITITNSNAITTIAKVFLCNIRKCRERYSFLWRFNEEILRQGLTFLWALWVENLKSMKNWNFVQMHRMVQQYKAYFNYMVLKKF